MKISYKLKFKVNDAIVVITASNYDDLFAIKNRVLFLSDDTEEDIVRDLIRNFSSFISISFADSENLTLYSNE